MPPTRRWTAGATCSRATPGGASSRWCTRTRISKVLTREAFENAIRTLAAIGGSTNAVIHLIAIAGRLGVKLTVDDFDRLGSEMPCLVNLQPSGEYLMEDFCYAGGLPAVMKEIAPRCTWARHRQRLHRGREHRRRRRTSTRASSRPWPSPSRKRPASPCCAATWRRAARSSSPAPPRPALMQHTGRAVVFEDSDDFHARIDDENAGRRRDLHPGAEELRPQGLPRHGRGRQHAAAAQGAAQGHHRHGAHQRRAHERHRLRHRGAAHRARSRRRRPAGAGEERRHDHAGRAEPPRAAPARGRRRTRPARRAGRLAAARQPPLDSGYWKLYIDHVLQADQGADLDFLVGQW
jgi:L-arabonate dehydrase